MELGGNAPCIVEDLVPDLEGTITRLVHGGFYQRGQLCIHMQRLYVRGVLYKEVKDALITAVKKLKGGDPHQDDTSIGPMISESSAATVEKSVNKAVKAAAKLLVGGSCEGSYQHALQSPSRRLYAYEDMAMICG
ncbi:hypothetical protein SELMODRAFT_425611 [Selaginella moellendorffii]|uniref:NADP-dependent glyceraldehyde-3-phosphate dehydrogenase n=1 Tax=Selaginella moellendorffii TaxID=88036 RepID=D8STN9_SELML|nr:hypothetical protein SELMODRAFT_425611 [Selaginella moellendorffii]